MSDPKAPFSIATTPRCRGRCYSIPWIAPLYPWSVSLMLSIKQGSIKYHFFESTAHQLPLGYFMLREKGIVLIFVIFCEIVTKGLFFFFFFFFFFLHTVLSNFFFFLNGSISPIDRTLIGIPLSQDSLDTVSF